MLFSYVESQELLAPQLVPELIEAGSRVYIKKERTKKSNDNLQQNYKRHKLNDRNNYR